MTRSQRVPARLSGVGLALALVLGACTSISTTRVSPDDLFLGAGVEPLAAIQVDVTSAYLLFVPIPGVDLDDALNRELVATAKAMGADKVANVEFRITPSGGVWSLRRLLGWRSARATGIAVRLPVDEGTTRTDHPDEGTRTDHPSN